MKLTLRKFIPTVAALCALALNGTSAQASIAFGSINNFDVVNDTGSECHGFEIELEDVASTEITYTFDWNHYGKSKFIPSTTALGKPATCVRWESAKNADGTWAAFTAIPAGPILPTDGHQFTNPNVNFGGEHFGVGYTRNPTAVRYFWLLDNGSGSLVRGPEVQVSTPVFNYLPPVGGAVAQVQAVIQPVVPEALPPKEFGDPVWVKEIRTTTHNNNEVKLRDLVSDDPDDANDPNWRNGEPDEVEVEWQLLQTDYNKGDGGANGELVAAPEDLDNGDEVVTRRYEFFKYTGPIDNETGEAMADNVGADDVHGDGVKIINGVEVDLSTVEVVGDYIGAQMAAFDPAVEVGLIDQIPDGELDAEYPSRTVIIAGGAPFTATTEGELPAGMSFDLVTGVLSGTPTEAGTFSLIVNAQEGALPVKTKSYSFIIAAGGVQPPPQSVVDTSALPANGGSTTGDGTYDNGTNITVNAAAAVGFAFVNWSDNGNVVSNSASYTFTTNVNRSLIANFAPVVQNFAVSTSASPANLGTTSGDGSFVKDTSVTVTATPNAGAAFVAWSEGGNVVSNSASYTFNVTADRVLAASFVALHDITTTASPAVGGAVSGSGTVIDGTSVTVTAAPNAGFAFVNWTEGGAQVSTSASYTFTATASRALVANFVQMFTITTAASPATGGSTSGGGVYASGTGVTVSAVANPGYAFANWTVGGVQVSVSANYTFTAAGDRALVANFQPLVVTPTTATFNGLVTNFVTPTAGLSGLITITTSAGTRAYTAKLTMGGASYSLKGVLDAAGFATAKVARKGQPALIVGLQLTAATGFTGTVSDGTSAIAYTARPCPYSSANPLLAWPGQYTHMIGFTRPLRAPLPVGTGTHVISANGAVRVIGKLSDGTSYTCSSLVTDAGLFPLYAATASSKSVGFLVSNVVLDAGKVGSIADGSPLTWKPATTQPFGRFAFYMSHFTPVPRGTTALKVDLGVHNLNVLATNPIGGGIGGWTMMLGTNNVAVDLGTGPGPISLSIDKTTGIVSGKVTLGGASRTVTGVAWQDSNSGFAIVPGYGDQATLTLLPIYTGP